MVVSVTHKGDFKNMEKFLNAVTAGKFIDYKLNKYGQEGVDALMAATPKDTGKTAESWSYEITKSPDSVVISWNNSNLNKGVNIAMLIQFGHGTRNGGYVQGVDYINPALRPVFEKMADDIWKEVVSR